MLAEALQILKGLQGDCFWLFPLFSFSATAWRRVLEEKIMLFQNFSACYGIRMIITVFTTACHLSPS
jgi:hypothetical protein